MIEVVVRSFQRRVLVFVMVTGLALMVPACSGGLDGSSCAQPPTQEERIQLESFLKAHVEDARDLEWTVMDCDDDGLAWLNFTTSMTPGRVEKAFLKDSACLPSRAGAATAFGNVTCHVGEINAILDTEPDTGTWTEGTLTPRPQ